MAKTVIALEATMNASGAEGSVKSLKAQLREAQAEVTAMADKFGLTSDQAQKAATKAAQLKDAIGDAKTLTDSFNPDAKFKSFSNAIQGVVGGFTALQGAQALFGVESEDVAKTLAKVQGAMALSQGINSVLEAGDAFEILGKKIITKVVTAFSTLRGAIISTGLGALVVAIGLVINYFSDMADAADEAAEATKKANEATKKYADIGIKAELDYLDREQKLEISKLKLKENNEEAIFQKEQEYRNAKGRSLQRYYEEIKGVDDKAAAETMIQMKNLMVEIQVADNEHKLYLLNKKREHNKEVLDADKDLQSKLATLNEQNYLSSIDNLNEKEKAKIEWEYQKNVEEINRSIAHESVKQQMLSALRYKYNADKTALDEKTKKEELDADKDLQSKLATLNEQNYLSSITDLDKREREKIRWEYEKNVDEINRSIAHESVKQQMLSALKYKFLADNEALDEKSKKAELERQQALSNALLEVKLAELDAIGAGAGILKMFSEKNKSLQRAALIAENAVTIAKIILNTQAANSAVALKYAIIPGGQPIAAAEILANKIKAGIGIATAIAATAKGLQGIGGGGGAGGGGNMPNGGGGGVGAPIGPQMGATALQQAQINAAGSAAVQAFVLESDVSGNQERIERLNRAARIQ